MFASVPLGLCEDYPEESRSADEVARDLALMKSAGIEVLRVSIGWDGIEPARGRYDLAFWDAFVAQTAAAHVRVIPYVAYTPRWNSPGGDADYWKRPPVDLGAFAHTMGVLAARYRGRIGSWELWNEPDNRDYWLGSAADYAALLEAGARAVHAADPAAQVVFGGVAGHAAFATEVMARPGIAPLVDVVNAHAYFETWNGEAIETLPRYVAAFAPALAAGARPLWLAEVGYGTHRRGAEVSASVRARFAYEHTPAFQAVALVRTVALALTRPEVHLLAWYEVKDLPATAPVIGDENNRHLGVAFSDWRPKPALAALALMVRLFGEGFARLDDRVRVQRPAGSRAEVHAFLSRAGRAIVVAWLPTVVPGAAAVGPQGNELDRRRERVAVELPVVAAGPARMLDAVGQEVGGAPAVRAGVSATRVDDVEIRGGDVVVLELPVRDVGR